MVWAHSGARLGVGGIQFIAGVGVCLFLICSGYGLEMSYRVNGLPGFWKKHLFNVVVPFWIVEFIGLSLKGNLSFDIFIKDFLFIDAATSYGWFMQYIVICYLIFYGIKRITERTSEQIQLCVFFAAFTVWFIIDSVLFAKPDMPFLRARQMYAFPIGIAIAQYRISIKHFFERTSTLVWGGIIGIVIMAVTQTNFINSFPVLFANMLSIFTVVPLAFAVLSMATKMPLMVKSSTMKWCGLVSYEIYLVHAFTLSFVKPRIFSIFLFLVITSGLAGLLHMLLKVKENFVRN